MLPPFSSVAPSLSLSLSVCLLNVSNVALIRVSARLLIPGVDSGDRFGGGLGRRDGQGGKAPVVEAETRLSWLKMKQ